MPASHGSREEVRPLSIGALSRATRIPIETLRTWERRYGVPEPLRGETGHRRFAASSVEHLRKATRLLAQGFRPGEILKLSTPELDRLLGLTDARGPAVALDARRTVEPSVEALCDAAIRYDRVAVVAGLRTNWSRLGPMRFLEDVMTPFLVEIGRRWELGGLDIRHEHFASECAGDVLRELREPFDQKAKGPTVAMATLPGDLHEGGLLMASMVVALRGGRVLYLGTDTPTGQIAAAAEEGRAEIVALGVSSSMSRSRAKADLEDLRGALAKRVPIWVGGASAPVDLPSGVVRLASLVQLDELMAKSTGSAL